MRRIVGSLAALLSLLMVSTSVSASACDLSCWLQRAHSNCRAEGFATWGIDMAMSMPSDMDMGTNHSAGMIVAGTAVMIVPSTAVTTPVHSMSMSAQAQIPTKRFDCATKSETGTTGMPDHSKTVSSCTHEPCSQPWASVSPPRGDHSQLSSPHPMAISISNFHNLCIGATSIRLGTHPPKLPAVERLITTLRI
jgi:hypothetical protein